MPTSAPKLHILLHLAGAVNFAYCVYGEAFIINIPEELSPTRNKMGGALKYLTHWNVWLQLLFYVLSLANDLFGSRATEARSSSRLQAARDFLFASLAFPMGVAVAAMFWAIWSVDRELVMPARFDPWIPPHLNHALHTAMLPLLVLELGTVYHVYPKRRSGIATIALFVMSYLAWVFFIAFYGGFWVYPILKKLDAAKRTLFLVVCAAGSALLYIGGEILNNLVWSQHVQASKRAKVK